MLGLTQRLMLNRTQTLHSLHQGRELLLEEKWGHRDWKLLHISQVDALNGCAARESNHPALYAVRSEASHQDTEW